MILNYPRQPENATGGNPSTGPATPSGEQRHLAADTPSVIHSETQSVLPTVQAAQLEHKSDYIPISDSIGPLAGGHPQTPVSPPKAAKKRRAKRRDNHLSFRAEDDVLDIVAERMAHTGESQSDAVRAIIRESQDKAGNIYLAPKTPPDQLEKLLSEFKKWRIAFATAKPRLNIATPADDDERHAEVVAWREEADRLLREIPQLEEVVKVALATLTSLTPERVARFKTGINSLTRWKKGFIEQKKNRWPTSAKTSSTCSKTQESPQINKTMPYSNSIGTPTASLTAIAVYLANDGHKHHQDYELTPIQVLGAKSVQDFIDYAENTFRKNCRKGTGRPPQNAANWIIVRTPDGSHLEDHERTAYENAARDVAGLGGPVVGILNWHRNKYTGAADMNLLSAAFTSSGERVRDRDTNPIKTLRWRMDEVTDALNVLRISRGIPPIVTMQEIKKERAQQRGEMDVVEELAKLPKPPRITADLKPALIKLEYSISRFNLKLDTISIIPNGKKGRRNSQFPSFWQTSPTWSPTCGKQKKPHRKSPRPQRQRFQLPSGPRGNRRTRKCHHHDPPAKVDHKNPPLPTSWATAHSRGGTLGTTCPQTLSRVAWLTMPPHPPERIS